MQKEPLANLLIAIFSIILYVIMVVVFMLTNNVSSVFELCFFIGTMILVLVCIPIIFVGPYYIIKDNDENNTPAAYMVFLLITALILSPIFLLFEDQLYFDLIDEFSFTNIYYLILLGLCIIVSFLINTYIIFTNNNFTFIRRISHILIVLPYVIFFGIWGVSLGCIMLTSFSNLGSDIGSILLHLYVGIFNIVLTIGLLLIPIGITVFSIERMNDESKRDEEAFDI